MQEQQFRQTLQSINHLQLQNTVHDDRRIIPLKNSSNFAQIMPISMQQNTNRENEIPHEFEPDKSVYKSFIDEFYTIKSNPNNTSRYQKKKIFDDENSKSGFVSQVSEKSCAQPKFILNNQEIHQVQQIQCQTIQYSNYLDAQVANLDSAQKQKFKLECLKDMTKDIVEVFKNKDLSIYLKVLSLKRNVLECQLIYQNSGNVDISCLDILYSNDSMLKLSKSNDRFYNLSPSFGLCSNLLIEIVAIPFSFITLSIEYNNHFYRQLLPITILNFIEDQRTIQYSTLQAKFFGQLTLKKKTNYVENKIIQGKIHNHQIEIQTKKDLEIQSFYCKSDLEQINWQTLNTLYFLFDL